jgi:hypothetical protein
MARELLFRDRMVTTMSDATDPRLRFVDNSQLESPLVEPLDVRTQAGVKIGKFDGVIVDPAQRRVRYLVVDRGVLFHKRCLIPMPSARVDAQSHSLSIDVDAADSQQWARFDPVAFPRFSDDDLITAMFSPHAVASAG